MTGDPQPDSGAAARARPSSSEAIEFVESFAHLGLGQGGYNEDHEFYGYRMPI
jgi:hypothetical protein